MINPNCSQCDGIGIAWTHTRKASRRMHLIHPFGHIRSQELCPWCFPEESNEELMEEVKAHTELIIDRIIQGNEDNHPNSR